MEPLPAADPRSPLPDATSFPIAASSSVPALTSDRAAALAAPPRPLAAEPGPGAAHPLPGVVHLGSFPPRANRLATYMHDVARAVAGPQRTPYDVVAVEDAPGAHGYDVSMLATIVRDDPQSYARAAAAVDRSGTRVVDLQHAFGLFGGDAGELLLGFLERVRTPVVTTLHTTLPEPTVAMRQVTRAIAAHSRRVVVLSRAAADILIRDHGIAAERIRVIPHGVPTIRPTEPVRRRAKAALGLEGRTVLGTFGLLGRDKGIETVIEAIPAIVADAPEVLYVVAGATHPAVLRTEGEAYRRSLEAQVARLGLRDHVRFDDRYLSRATVLRYLEATDVYAMADRSPNQVVSGTLAYALGAGRAVVATPFTHAREVLAHGRGVLVPYDDPASIAQAVRRLLVRPVERAAIERRAFALARDWQWPAIGRAYRSVLREALPQGDAAPAPIVPLRVEPSPGALDCRWPVSGSATTPTR